ncbi:TIGR04255 family protein [Sphingobacterium corticibacter]|uniref:TIGR04255 family protein n=1 Tax=Sphingobacterium corticibacter TaxID=2171749 RepID=A0A2T8HK16_9SPHI|nr:TIGR04255 family protein [Sphingobacterium corticibacter]PVH25781.1 hypothetical protein DC487_07560 [Sphingobacterium corticibacter]
MSLRPVKDKHSISRSVVNLFLAQNFPESEIILRKIIASDKFATYSRKGTISEKLIQFGDRNISVSDNKNSGFVLERFENGSSSDILKMENTPNGKSILSIETRNYTRWQHFVEKITQDLSDLSAFKNFYVEAIGLTYVDEFIWESSGEMAIEEIFNTNSQMLNEKFLKSKTSSIVSTFVDTQVSGYGLSEEKSEISFNEHLKRVIISHTYILQFQKLKELDGESYNSFISEFDSIHSKNKEFLQDILSENTQGLINLNI